MYQINSPKVMLHRSLQGLYPSLLSSLRVFNGMAESVPRLRPFSLSIGTLTDNSIIMQ